MAVMQCFHQIVRLLELINVIEHIFVQLRRNGENVITTLRAISNRNSIISTCLFIFLAICFEY